MTERTNRRRNFEIWRLGKWTRLQQVERVQEMIKNICSTNRRPNTTISSKKRFLFNKDYTLDESFSFMSSFSRSLFQLDEFSANFTFHLVNSLLPFSKYNPLTRCRFPNKNPKWRKRRREFRQRGKRWKVWLLP